MDIRNHRVGIRNHHVGTRNSHIGIDCQLSLKGGF
jgi:hypothetical protein